MASTSLRVAAPFHGAHVLGGAALGTLHPEQTTPSPTPIDGPENRTSRPHTEPRDCCAHSLPRHRTSPPAEKQRGSLAPQLQARCPHSLGKVRGEQRHEAFPVLSISELTWAQINGAKPQAWPIHGDFSTEGLLLILVPGRGSRVEFSRERNLGSEYLCFLPAPPVISAFSFPGWLLRELCPCRCCLIYWASFPCALLRAQKL